MPTGTLVDWIDRFTIVAYVVAAFLCWRRIGVIPSPERPWRFGLAMGVLLGVNKHFGFHWALTRVGRQLVRDIGLYANHRLSSWPP